MSQHEGQQSTHSSHKTPEMTSTTKSIDNNEQHDTTMAHAPYYNNHSTAKSGRFLATLVIVFGSSTAAVALFAVLFGCQFYAANWEDEYYAEQNLANITFSNSTGVAICKVFLDWQGFNDPKNGIDKLAACCALLAFVFGLMGVLILWGSFRQCWLPCLQKFTFRLVAGLFGVAFIFQSLTLLVFLGPACRDEYSGGCTPLWNSYVSIGASIVWFLSAVAVLKIPPPPPISGARRVVVSPFPITTITVSTMDEDAAESQTSNEPSTADATEI
jgi:hypothetical protein